MTERQRFIKAFYKLLKMGKPTPTLLNKELGRVPWSHSLPGRLSKLRRELLAKNGYVQKRTEHFVGQWKKER